MARVSLLNKEQVGPGVRELFEKIESKGYPILNLYRVMAHCPQLGRTFLRLGNMILFKGTLPPNLRELAILRVGHLHQAKYEWTQHVAIALQAGVSQEQIDALPDWGDSGSFNERERVFLRYTDEVTKEIRVKDDTFAAVRNFLNEEGVVELTLTIGYYAMVCRILEALQVELEN
jgi:4-carboxymuconolactone decarboxylase